MTHQTDTHTVLIVDDSPSNLSVAVNLMEDRGYRVAIAQDGEEGLQRAGLVQPGLILLDVMLPGADGFEICRRLKAQEKTRNIPVIFMTSLASIEHKINGFDAGGVDYVTKPLQIDEFMARVDTQLKLYAAQRQLEAQNVQLAKHSEELKQRVAERTEELATRNLQLREEVAERKRMEEAARASERQFRSLAENMPDNIARWDRAGHFLYINPTHELTLGMPLAAVVGKRGCKIFPDGRFNQASQVIAQVLETGQAQFIRVDVPQDDGSLRIHEVNYVPERNAQGEIVSVLGIGRDMTERYRMEQAIIQSEAALRSLTDSAPFSIIRYDIEGRITYVNAPLLGYFGIPLAELIGKRPCEIWPDGRFAAIDRGIAQVRETKAEAVVEFPELGAECKTLHHQVWIVPEKDALNEVVGIIAFGFNITERKRAEREAYLLNRALDNSFDATYLLGIDLRFRYVNEAAVRALGYSREELLSLSLLDIDPNITREMVHGLMEQTAVTGCFPGVVESRHRRKNGETFPVEVGASTFSHGNETLFLTAVRDITERKRAEALLMKREREFRTLAENMPDNIIRHNRDGVTVYVNPEIERTLGNSAAAMIGSVPREYFPDGSYEDYAQLLDTVLASGEAGELEKILPGPDGETSIHQIRMVPERGENGEVIGALVIGRDITRRKQKEALLHSLSRKLKAISRCNHILVRAEHEPELLDGVCKLVCDEAGYLMAWVGFAENDEHKTVRPVAQSGYENGYLDGIQITWADRERGQGPIGIAIRTGVAAINQDFQTYAGVAPWREAAIRRGFRSSVAIPLVSKGRVLGSLNIYSAKPHAFENEEVELLQELANDIAYGVQALRARAEKGRAEDALRTSEREFRTLAENMPDILIRYDREGRRTYINPTLKRSYAVRAEQMVGLTQQESNPFNMPEAYRLALEHTLASGERSEIELQIPTLSGEMRTNLIFIAADRAEDGQISGAITIGHDITERKRAELQLQLKEFALDQAREAIYLIDNDNNYRFAYVNEEACRSLGYSRDELLGFTPRDIDPGMKPEDGIRLREKTPNGSLTFETRHCRRDGSSFPVELRSSEIIFNGQKMSMVLARDITEQKRAEQLLEESHSQLRGLIARNEMVREEERKRIAREVHDELGQILTSLRLNVFALSNQFGQDSPELREQLSAMLELVNKSQAVARNVAISLRSNALDMGIVSGIEWVVGQFAQNTGIRCEMQVREEDRDLHLDESSSVALFRITQESLTNIARYAKASKVDISIRLEGDDTLLEIRDNGIGFDPATLKKGSFGLIGIRERVNMLGGEFSIHSMPGSGTTIKVRVPTNS